MPDAPVIVALDGPAASGKGTLGRRLASHFGYAYLDSGLLYRAVGWRMLREGLDPGDVAGAARIAAELEEKDLKAVELREDRVANAATIVAAHPDVRQALVGYQRGFAAQPPLGAPGAVIDGRDIGTVICPDADCKIFVDAGVEVRARRRLKELRDRGVESIYSRVLRDMEERDARDRNRPVAPLIPADDAFKLDTTDLDADAAFELAAAFIAARNKPDKS
ncbi:MAG: (d)CMP kinase [Rhodospirillales bacterium]|nr:(d)CMP kinase [Rhodospirillales bacterium]